MSAAGVPAGPPAAAPPTSAPLRPIDSHCHLADDAFKTDIIDVRASGPGRPERRPALCILDAGERRGAAAGAASSRELWPACGSRSACTRMHADTYRDDPQGAARAIERALDAVPRRLRPRRDGARLPLRFRAARSSRRSSRRS